jgi:hypothetical protein
MNLENILCDIAVIIDNEIWKEDSDIVKIKRIIEGKNIPVAAYNEIPKLDTIKSMSNASFIILDWDYLNAEIVPQDSEERVVGGLALSNENEIKLIEFIKAVLTQIFVPVFIFSAIESEKIVGKLIESSLWDESRVNRIFIKQKTEILSEENLFDAINEWLKSMPSAYVLKEWNHVITDSKNRLFLEMYQYSPNWVKIIWDMMKTDSIENQYEFGVFISNNLVSRIDKYSFDEEYLGTSSSIMAEELSAVIQGERYISYSESHNPVQAYTGDIFILENKYYLNVRAQCDLAREENPKLYCIIGNEVEADEILTKDIHFLANGSLVFTGDDTLALSDIEQQCSKSKTRGNLNYKLRQYRNRNYIANGEILEKKREVIVPCIADKKAIKFSLDMEIKEFTEVMQYRIGRLLPPYITRVQQKFAQYIVREGVMPVPDTIFDDPYGEC